MKKIKLNHNEIIILSVVIGVFIALIMGYVFSKDYYINDDGHKVYGVSRYYTESSEFNYLLAFGSLIIVSGISYLYFKKIKFADKSTIDEPKEIDTYTID